MIQNKKTLASILFVLISFVCSAQLPPPPQQVPSVPVGAPIDNSLFLLMVSGILYGIHFFYRLRKKQI